MAGNLNIGVINGANIAIDPVLNKTQLMGALNASGTAPIYACRAWVNFDGTGTVAIRASGNVSSITDNGVGDYTVNFTTAMPDANYSYCISSDRNTAPLAYILNGATMLQATSFKFNTANASLVLQDTAYASASIFR